MELNWLENTYLYKKINSIHPLLGKYFLFSMPRSIVFSIIGALILLQIGGVLLLFGNYSVSLKCLFVSLCLYLYAKFQRAFLKFDAFTAGKNALEMPFEYLIVFFVVLLTFFLSLNFPWDTLDHALLTHANEEFKINTLLGVLGDFFGGVLNPILSFFTIIILILQHKEISKREDSRDRREKDAESEKRTFEETISKREDDRDIRNHLKNYNDEFFRDLDFIKTTYEEIRFMELTGFDALDRLNTFKTNGNHIPNKALKEINVSVGPAAEFISINLKSIIRNLIKSNSLEEELELTKKHFEYFKNVVTPMKLEALGSTLEHAEPGSLSEGEKFIIKASKLVRDGQNQYPKNNDIDSLKSFVT